MGVEIPAQNLISKDFLEEQLSEKEILLRELFIDYYLATRDPYEAAVCCGFIEGFAEEFARKFMSEGYVRRRIHERETELDPAQHLEMERRRTLAMLSRHEADRGPGSSLSARVAATALKMDVLGMKGGAWLRDDTNEQGESIGGVMRLPALSQPSEWGNWAEKSQKALKQNVVE